MTPASPEHDYGTLAGPETLRIQRRLPGPIERVWAHLVQGDLRRQWLADGDMPPEVGAPFEMTWRNDELTDPPGARPEGFGVEHRMQTKVTAFDPPRHLAFLWSDGGEVSIRLEPQGEDVLLTLVHTRIADRHERVMIGSGWHVHLDLLVDRLHGQRSEPYWDRWIRLRDEYEQRLPS